MKYEKIIALIENKKEVGSISANTEGAIAYFKIIGRIWSWTADESSVIRAKVDEAIAAGKTKAVIEGSSEGGSVFATNDLLALFQQFDDVKIKVNALMASAFTYLTSHFHTTIKSNTQGMIHMPMLSARGNIKALKNTIKLGENLTKDYAKAYAKKTGKTEKEIQALWNDGDYWMDAEELLAEGFVDAIEGEVTAFTEFDVAALATTGAPIVPQAKTTTTKTTPNTTFMNKEEEIGWLGLKANATDQEIKDAKAALKADALKHRENQPQTPNADAEAQLAKAAKVLVAEALKAKKITAPQVADYEKLAIANFTATSTVLEGMQAIPNLTGELTPGSNGKDPKANWTFSDYLTNDPNALEQLLVDNPEAYKKLEAEYHNTL